MKIKKCIVLILVAAMTLPLMACGDFSELYEVDLEALEEMEELPEGVDPEAIEAYKQAQRVQSPQKRGLAEKRVQVQVLRQRSLLTEKSSQMRRIFRRRLTWRLEMI
ncbi:MAG: hypothetical protein K5770_10040 [Lachnospiraceae bacterium]|nr:hypothetical protein [Lachnospiraceae bacterium]